MLGSRPLFPLASLGVAAFLIATVPGFGEACAQGATAWKIATERDQFADRVSCFAVTLPKSDPVMQGKSVTTALILRCAGVPGTARAHPELMILFTSLPRAKHAKAIGTRYRFDDGAVRDYKLKLSGRNGAHAMLLPKFSNEDPVADVVAAKRLRVEIDLPSAGPTLLDFNITGAADAVKAIACQWRNDYSAAGSSSRTGPWSGRSSTASTQASAIARQHAAAMNTS